MKIEVCTFKEAIGQIAAARASVTIRTAIQEHGTARVIFATGSAQFDLLNVLTADKTIDWKQVEMFHLDEYIGLSEGSPASFCRFLRERLLDKTGITRFHLLDGMADPQTVIADVTAEIDKRPVDLAIIGIGENAHLAFNDPPADFETREAFHVVALDHACRMQQLNEGWFPTLEAVPTHAISMTVHEMLKAAEILAIVPDQRKAEAVANSFNGEISPMYPASILRTHAGATLYLDTPSASLLSSEALQTYA